SGDTPRTLRWRTPCEWLQRLSDGAGTLVAVAWPLCHHLRDDGRQSFGNLGPQRADGRWLLRAMAVELAQDRLIRKRNVACQHVIKRATEGVDIAPEVRQV